MCRVPFFTWNHFWGKFTLWKKKITILSNNYASLDTPMVIYSLEFLIPRFIKTKFTDSSCYKSLVNIWCHINVFELSISCCFKINIQKYCGSPNCATLDVLCTRNFPRINTSFFRLDMALFFPRLHLQRLSMNGKIEFYKIIWRSFSFTTLFKQNEALKKER